METLRSNVNNIQNYPNKETMELFLELWKSTWILAKWVDGYKNINAVITLAVVCDYLCQNWKEKEKQSFLEEIKEQWEQYYKKIWELALNIWEQKWNLTPFSQSMIKSNRERLQIPNRTHSYFPIIVKSDFPWRIEKIEYTKMIHEEFEAELARLKWVSEWANQIQTETDKHKFDRWVVDPKMIEDLKDKL